MLVANDLGKAYNGTWALEALDLHVPRGEIFCLLGANGAGKTTTINLFLGFTQPTRGTARVNDLDVASHTAEARQVAAYIPEQVVLYRSLSGLENLEYFSALAGHGEYDERQLLGFLSQVGLPADAARRRVAEYSKGMNQKVGIAIALAKRAQALLLDEPTSGLDPQAANEFTVVLRSLRDAGAAVLMATHDLFRAKEVGSRVGIMKHGRLVVTLSTAEIGHTDLERIYLEHMRD